MKVNQSKMEIEQAAGNAVKVIADAASEAAKVLANAASEAVKVSSVKSADDHDLLIKLETKMDALKEDIRDIKDGTSKKISDHETRMGKIEDFKNTQTILNAIGLGLLIILAGIILYHVGLTGSAKIL